MMSSSAAVGLIWTDCSLCKAHLTMSFAIFRLGQRYISRRLLQSVLFVVGVALGVAMVIAIDIANSSSSRAFDQQVSVRIVGLLQAPDQASAQAIDNLLLTDIATAQEIAGTPGHITRIDLILPADYDLQKIKSILPQGTALTTPNAENSAL